MPDWLNAIILGLIEGLTEFIPVSSTGHLLIAEKFMNVDKAVFNELFTVVIQCGAVLALVPLFWKRISAMMVDWRKPANQDYAIKLLSCFVLTAIIGLIAKKFGMALPDSIGPIAWATFIGAFVIFGMEAWARVRFPSNNITWVVVGACAAGQIIAMLFPGASRSGSTIMLAMACGLARPAATEFSFLIGIPTIMAAGGLKILEAIKHKEVASTHWGLVVIGTLTAAISAFVVVKWLIKYVQSHTFNGFAFYRLALGLLLLGYFYGSGG